MARKKVDNIDELIVTEGQKFDETKYATAEVSELAYDDNAILSGSDVQFGAEDNAFIKDKATAQTYVKNTVDEIHDREAQAKFNKMSEDAKIKNYVYEMEYYSQTNKFFREYGYEMSGKQKRTLKRNIDNAWKKGKIKLTKEMRENILFEISNMELKKGDASKEAITGRSTSSSGATQIASVFSRL